MWSEGGEKQTQYGERQKYGDKSFLSCLILNAPQKKICANVKSLTFNENKPKNSFLSIVTYIKSINQITDKLPIKVVKSVKADTELSIALKMVLKIGIPNIYSLTMQNTAS